MESLHRTGGQLRLELPGARWLETTSQAIFNLRMLQLAGRWKEFWGHKAITPLLVRAFAPKPDEATTKMTKGLEGN